MIITIDSNVPTVPVEIVRLLPRSIVSAPWCTAECVCESVDGTSDRVLYDTPIAMCPDTDVMFVDPDAVDNTFSFVYLDASVQNPSYGRITRNLPRFKQTVVVSANNADSDAAQRGAYTVVFEKNNCGTDMVVKFMALMVNAYAQRKMILHPESLLPRKSPPNSRDRCIDDNGFPVRCDLYSFSKYESMRGNVLDDCDLMDDGSDAV